MMSVDQLSKLVDDQTSKLKDQVSSIRAIHGDVVAKKMTLVGNMISTNGQIDMVMLSLVLDVVMNDEKRMNALPMIAELLDHNRSLTKQTFFALFIDEPKVYEEMCPFFVNMHDIVSEIVRNSVGR